LWPLVASRGSATVLVAVAAAATEQLRLPGGAPRRLAITAGLFDVIANGAVLYAFQFGMLSMVSVLTSLYPASTVLLARVVLKERTGWVQRVGLMLAAVSVAMIAGAPAG
jgi:drug/metabolite transporter (DMT)-like permease